MPTRHDDTTTLRHANKTGVTPIIGRLLLAAVCLASMAWLLTHDGCAHPIGNTLALIAYVASGTVLLLPHAIAWAERNGLTGAGEEER